MSLLDQAAADVRDILRDTVAGFATAVTLIAPDGRQAALTGLAQDIGVTLDPDTGMPVAGRKASLAVPLTDVLTAGLGVPEGVPETNRRPWVVTWVSPQGEPMRFKITSTAPDQLGSLVLYLAVVRPA